MSIWDEMRYGPLGAAVEAAMPQSEADPIGVYAASLAMFSASISRGVRLENGRPVVVWTVLAGRSAIGRKGYALGTAKALIGSGVQGFLNARTRNGVGSGPALVDLLYKTELTSLATSEDGLDGRVMIEEEEWAGILKVQKKCAKFSTLFRTASWVELASTLVVYCPPGPVISMVTRAKTPQVCQTEVVHLLP